MCFIMTVLWMYDSQFDHIHPPLPHPLLFTKMQFFQYRFFFFEKKKAEFLHLSPPRILAYSFLFVVSLSGLTKRVVPFLHYILLYVMVSKALVFFLKGLVYQSLGLEFFFYFEIIFIAASVLFLIIDLLKLCISSWFNFGKLYVGRKPSISVSFLRRYDLMIFKISFYLLKCLHIHLWCY